MRFLSAAINAKTAPETSGAEFIHIWGLFLVYPFAVIELGEAAFGGFPEAVVQVYTCLLHGPADHIVADISGACQEIA